MTIDIAVPTYNCARWIDGFMESLLAQDYQDWRIVTRDDGSKDNTVELVAAWKERLDDKIAVIENPGMINLGAVENYDAILHECTATLIMMGDPDDIWKPGKISMSLNVMLEAQRKFGNEIPIIVCTDAEMVDEKLDLISPSFWRWARMSRNSVSELHRMVMESPVLGATMIFNRALISKALPLTGAACQDWWLALVACAFGKIVVVDAATISYRRHQANDSFEPLTATYFNIVKNFSLGRNRLQLLARQLAPQAKVFLHRFRIELSSVDVKALEVASKLGAYGPVTSRFLVFKHKLWFGSILKNIGMMAFL